MPDSPWLANLKQTMAIDVGRFIAAQWSPKAIVGGLFEHALYLADLAKASTD